MPEKIDKTICRIALFMIWLIVLTPVYSANALEIAFNPDTGVQVTDNSATITWTTDEESTGSVKYGVDGTPETKKSGTPKTEHSVEITGIAPSRTFQFYIEAENETDTVRSPPEGGDFHSFTTETPRDRTLPHAVKSLAAPTITRNSITLTWEKDERDDDIDYYNIYREGELIAEDVKQKSYTDSGLNFSTEYTYMVSAVDLAGNPGPKKTLPATTRSESYQPILITGFKAEAVGTNIYLTWTTNLASHTRARYSQNPLLLDQKQETPDLVTQHNMTLADMPPNADITMMAESCDLTGNCGNSTALTVKTAEKIALMLAVDGMDCNPGTAAFSNTNRLDVRGSASPGSDVNIYVNGKRERFKRVTSTGIFNFAGIDLDPGRAENEIRVTAADHVSQDKECFERVRLDYYTPEVDFSEETKNLTITTQPNVQLKGNLTDDNKVSLYVYLQSVDDTIPPPAPENVTNTSLSADSVTISWAPYGEEVDDIYKYLIYRTDVPDGPIAAAEPGVTEFSDGNVSSSTTYTYQISAVDKAGNEGQRSSPFSVTTLPGEATAAPRTKIIPPNPGMAMTKEYVPANETIQFTESIGPLFEGKNIIKMQFIDEAGNIFEESFEIIYDKEPPRIITPTSAEVQERYSPSYVNELLITGQMNKPTGEIWVWVNSESEEPTAKVNVGENGTFEAEIVLVPGVGAAIGAAFTAEPGEVTAAEAAEISGPSVARGEGRQNKVKLVPVDSYGRMGAAVEANIEYTPCGESYQWSVQLKQGGNLINTRELLEGVAAYGFGYELEWIGGGDVSKAKAQNVRIVKAQVGTKEREKYDFDWLAGEPRVMCRRGNCTKGFIMINFLPQAPEGETYLEKEKNLSGHRKGECWPLAGCIHLLLEMQIDSDPSPLIAQYGASPTGPPAGMPPMRAQRQCIDVRIMLDERVDFASSDFVKSLLEASLSVINSTLNFIEVIEKPLKYVTQVTLAICLVTFLSKFIIDALKGYYCKWGGAISKLKGDSGGVIGLAKEIKEGKIEKVAQMHDGTKQGACYIEFPEVDGSKGASQACRDCANWISKSRWVTDKWHLFCDRVMCPSVPSLQHYIKTKWPQGRKSLWRPPTEEKPEEAMPTKACIVFSNNAETSNMKMTADCSCGTAVCKASTDDESRVCRADQCLIVIKECRAFSAASPAKFTAADLDDNMMCRCGNGVCIAGQTCDATAGRCSGMTVATTGMTGITSSAVTDIDSESSSLPSTEEGEPEDSLITGFASASSPKSYQTKPPVYDQVFPYKEGDWKRSDIKRMKSQSDCELVDMGRIPIKEMYEFYKKGDAEKKKICQKGHVPQPACCPFEYMKEWGWGMMYTNEMKTSYCLAHPDDKDTCGMGQKIIKGVTGICQPKGTKPRAVPVVLDKLRWPKEENYPASSDEMLRDDVVYAVDIDDKGSAKSVQRGYFSRGEVKEFVGEMEESGRIEISTGAYFVPEPGTEGIAMEEWFSIMDNSDISKDEDRFDEGLSAFKQELKGKMAAGQIVVRHGYKIDWKKDGEEWYRQIAGLLGDPGRQYLAQPAGSFIQSVLTLCLSGILSWIVQFKNMLKLLRQCFQTILVTGDGSSGQCQALISQYICDLLYEAISCIIKRLGGSASSRIGMGGISGIFASISDASRGIMAESQSRYGDNNLFSSTFSAKNLIHDACIFMFTGEWPTDWSQIFETASYLPIDTSGLVYPVTRRWQAYDPNTGYSRYVYRIGYSVFAGADIHYDLKLVCSGPNEACPEGLNGRCDCSQRVTLAEYAQRGMIGLSGIELPVQRHQSGNCPETGDLQQGEYCTDEVLIVAEGQPLRFDKVVIDYRPVGAMGQSPYGGATPGYGGTTAATGTGFGGTMAAPEAVTGRIEGTVREIGGPPLGLCEFSIGQLAFRCGVELPPLGFARFISTELIKPENKPYTIGDSAIVSAKIEQALPQDVISCSQDCEFTKYLTVAIYNGPSAQGSARIYPLPGKDEVGERLNQNKVYDFTVFDEDRLIQHVRENGEGFEIKQEHFAMKSTAATRALPKGGTLLRYLIGQIQTVDITPPLTIKVTFDGSEFKFVTGRISPTTSKFEAEGEEERCEEQPDTAKLTEGINPDVTCSGFRFSLNAASIMRITKKEEIPKGDIILHYRAPETLGIETCPKEPVQWTMVLELRDADSVGGSGYQMSTGSTIDFETGEEQKREIKFNVVCKEGAKAPEEGSIADLTRMTAAITSDNEEHNKVFGLWVDADTLGPTEEIRVGDFEWIDPKDQGQGFRINIDSTAAYGILNIDVGLLGLTPGPAVQVQKAATALQTCGEAPCIEGIGDVNNRVIRLRISTGDPVFTFTGFRKVFGLEELGEEEVVLSKESPTALGGFVKADRDIPEDVKIHLRNYDERDDGFTIEIRTEPALMDVVGLGFSVKDKFDAANARVAIAGDSLPSCSEAGERIECFLSNKKDIVISTLGYSDWMTIDVSNLVRIAEVEIASLEDVPRGRNIVLTAENPSQYGVRASNLLPGEDLIISGISVSGGVVTMTIDASEVTQPLMLTVELLPMGLRTKSSTQMHKAGLPGVLSDCTTEEGGVFTDCIDSRGGDRITFSPGIGETPAQYRITDLKSTTDPCADIPPGRECTVSGITGTCWEPPITGIGKQCFSDCRKQYFDDYYYEIAEDIGKLPTDETRFCISEGAKCGVETKTGMCPSGKVCCPDGSGRPVTPTGKKRAKALGHNQVMHEETIYFCFEVGNCTISPTTCCNWYSCSDVECSDPQPAPYYLIDELYELKNKQRAAEAIEKAGGVGFECGIPEMENQGFKCVPSYIAETACQDGEYLTNQDLQRDYTDPMRCGDEQVCCAPTTTTLTVGKDKECSPAAICKESCGAGFEEVFPREGSQCVQGTICCRAITTCHGHATVNGLSVKPSFKSVFTEEQFEPCPEGSYCIDGVTHGASTCLAINFNNFAIRNFYCPKLKHPEHCGFALECPLNQLEGYDQAFAHDRQHGFFLSPECTGPSPTHETLLTMDYCKNSVFARLACPYTTEGREIDCSAENKVIPPVGATKCLVKWSDKFWRDACKRITKNIYCNLDGTSRRDVSNHCPSMEGWYDEPPCD